MEDPMRTITRHALLALGIAAAMLSTATGALADTPVSHSGVWGTHFLQDTAEYPGAHCNYDGHQVIHHVHVRFPVVYARDRSPARDRQTVGWRFNLQRSPDASTGWTTVYQSPVQRLSAFDDSPALFTAMDYTFSGDSSAAYRVLIGMRWYAVGSNTIEGNVTHRVDFYAGGAFTPNSFCPGSIF
jgi:hypothetical protein